jgi:dihydropteroate synthase
MGILNVTPDSFSDGGTFLEPETAIRRGLQMAEEGADIIDIGGESTRPGAKRIPAREQIQRVLPVIKGLKTVLPGEVIISIDTTLSEVASAAIDAGAGMINDISAGRDDDGMFRLAASKKVPVILMHMQGTPGTMQANPVYTNVMNEIAEFLDERIEEARTAGVNASDIIIDPGIGFGKSFEHNLEIIRHIDCLVEKNFLVLIGASRKKFLQILCNSRDPAGLTGATCAVTALGVLAGAGIFRVHDVRENRQTADLVYKMRF